MSPVKRLLKDRRGSIAMVVAAATPVLVGGMGLSVDTVQWTLAKRELQRQADSGAIAGAYSLAQGADVDAAVTDDLGRNEAMGTNEAPVIENAPTAGAFAGDDRAVRVVLATALDLPFSRLFLDGPVRVTADATAAAVANGEYCALSLETEDRAGIEMGGSSTVDLACGMATNSPSSTAVDAFGSSEIIASPISAVGYIAPSSNYADGTEIISYSVAQPDPFSGLANPVISGTVQNGNVNPKQNKTLSPGVYKGMDLKGTVTLNPGVYYIDGGTFSVGSQAKVTGSNVTIILTSATAASNPNSVATANINGGAEINLTASSTGTYAGILFYQDRRAAKGSTNKINGNSNSGYQGAFYFPNQELEFTGTSGMEIDCIQMVALRLDFSGNSTVRNICPAGSGAQAFIGTAVRLVG